MTEALGITAWPFSLKNFRYMRRRSAADLMFWFI
jgi:hypothetical protein